MPTIIDPIGNGYDWVFESKPLLNTKFNIFYLQTTYEACRMMLKETPYHFGWTFNFWLVHYWCKRRFGSILVDEIFTDEVYQIKDIIKDIIKCNQGMIMFLKKIDLDIDEHLILKIRSYLF